MISIKNSLGIQPLFKGYYGQKTYNTNTTYGQDYASSSDAMTSYGKALVRSPDVELSELWDKINATSDSDTISIEDAAKEFSVLNTTTKKKTDSILACTFETDKPEVVINKKSLLLLKELLLSEGNVPKVEDVIRTCLDEKTQTFNPRKYDSMFNANGKVKISAKLKTRPQNFSKELRDAKMQRRMQIHAVVEKMAAPKKAVEFKDSDYFVPLNEQQDSLISDLDKIENVPDDLKKSIQKSVYQNDFNIRKIYTDYYSLLNECKSLDDVRDFYPELELPKKPEQDGYNAGDSIRERLLKEDFDSVVINVLKKGHIDLRPKGDMYVELENSKSTTYTSMYNAGFHIGMPSQDLLNLLDKGDALTSKYSNVPKPDDKEMKRIANKQAVRTSNIWSDYVEMTRTTWLPIRLIKNKRIKPKQSAYKTTNMVNAYLYNLYKSDKNADYPANPLEQYNDENGLNREMRSIVNSAYWTRYKKEDEFINDPEFIDFQAKFDKKAIGESFEHLENNYTKAFFSKYWTPERVADLKQGMQNAYDMIYEKIALCEQINPKTVTNDDVNDLIEADLSEDVAPNIDEQEYADLKYMTYSIQNKDLKERCQSCIENPDGVDSTYFGTVYRIMVDSKEDEVLNEDKALFLLSLHDKYLNQVINSDVTQSEEEYVKSSLEPYRQQDGSYDYKKASMDSGAELSYFNAATRLTEHGEDEFNTLVEDKFIFGNNMDYKGANKVIGYYENIPETFKPKFISLFKASQKMPPEKLDKELGVFHDKISSWNYDNDEVLIMDRDKIPQKVVITREAKQELWNATGENIELFDHFLNKFYSGAQNRTGKKAGQGIKTVPGSGYDAEIKIMGVGGSLRMLSRPVTEEDMAKYNTGDGVNVKYVFDTCDGHL